MTVSVFTYLHSENHETMWNRNGFVMVIVSNCLKTSTKPYLCKCVLIYKLCKYLAYIHALHTYIIHTCIYTLYIHHTYIIHKYIMHTLCIHHLYIYIIHTLYTYIHTCIHTYSKRTPPRADHHCSLSGFYCKAMLCSSLKASSWWPGMEDIIATATSASPHLCLTPLCSLWDDCSGLANFR